MFPRLKVERLTSRSFRAQMDRVGVETLAEVEDRLAEAAISRPGIGLDVLFYDTTGFLTCIDATSERSEPARRGTSKQKRSDQRLLGLALLASREGHLPLCGEVHEGSRPDCRLFPEAFSRIQRRLAELSGEVQVVTVAYDEASLWRTNQSIVDDAGIGCVASVGLDHHRDLAFIPLWEHRRLGGDAPLQTP